MYQKLPTLQTKRFVLVALSVMLLATGCSPPPPQEPPQPSKVEAFDKDLDSRAEGHWSSVSVNVNYKHGVDVYITMPAGPDSVAQQNYCKLVMDAFADAGLTGYRLHTTLKVGSSDNTNCSY